MNLNLKKAVITYCLISVYLFAAFDFRVSDCLSFAGLVPYGTAGLACRLAGRPAFAAAASLADLIHIRCGNSNYMFHNNLRNYLNQIINAVIII